MNRKRKLAAGAGAALAVAGGGAAIAATQLSPSAESQAVVNDAAKQLGVDPTKLSDALKKALENRVDAAVQDGRLTEAQGKELKERIEAGTFPLFGGPALRGFGPRGFGFGGFGHHFGGGHLDAAAAYLGVTEDALRSSLEDGKSLADVAKENGKSVDGLVDALVADETKELDAAVAAGRLTKEQRDDIDSGLKERVTALVNATPPSGGPGFGFRGHHGFFFGPLGPPRDAPGSGSGFDGGSSAPPSAA